MIGGMSLRVRTRAVAVARLVVAVGVIGVLAYAYVLRVVADDPNPFDYFGYFTNLTSLLACAVLLAAGATGLRDGRVPPYLATARAVALSCMLVVAVVYNGVVPGTGSAPRWVSVVLHIVFPVLLLADWVFAGDRRPQRWSRLWLVLPYPLLWLSVVLVRGVTDGWVPYGFLLPGSGPGSLVLTMLALLAALGLSGVAVWALSRLPAWDGAPGRA